MKKLSLVLVFTAVLICFLVADESIADRLTKFGKESGKAYILPAVTAFGTDLNAGLFNSAKVLKPFRFNLGFTIVGSQIASGDKKFTATNPDASLYSEATVETPTVFGDNTQVGVFHSNYPGVVNDLVMPSGINLDIVPLVTPQINMGLPWGNEIMVRYLPEYDLKKDIGKVKYWGAGLKHSISYHIPFCPVDLAVQGSYQDLKIGDIIEIKDMAANAEISKTFFIMTLYGGIGYEKTTLSADYTYQQPTTNGTSIDVPISFDVDGDNQYRGTIGAKFRLLIMSLYGEYSISKYNNYAAGLTFGF